MSIVTLSRLLLLAFLLNEAIVVARSSAEERRRTQPSTMLAASLLLLVLFFFFALPLPEPLAWAVLFLQVIGLSMEILGEIQLSRANSFAITAESATQVQKNKLYRWLENPIYVGILIQVFAVAIWMPLAFITLAFMYRQVQSMVSDERQFLLTLNEVHRGLDSFLWN